MRPNRLLGIGCAEVELDFPLAESLLGQFGRGLRGESGKRLKAFSRACDFARRYLVAADPARPHSA
jgi:hypothetical protein